VKLSFSFVSLSLPLITLSLSLISASLQRRSWISALACSLQQQECQRVCVPVSRRLMMHLRSSSTSDVGNSTSTHIH
jgi:hypothetical protein